MVTLQSAYFGHQILALQIAKQFVLKNVLWRW